MRAGRGICNQDLGQRNVRNGSALLFLDIIPARNFVDPSAQAWALTLIILIYCPSQPSDLRATSKLKMTKKSRNFLSGLCECKYDRAMGHVRDSNSQTTCHVSDTVAAQLFILCV